MSKHNDIYNILGKLNALTPQEPKQDSILKSLNESTAPTQVDVVAQLNQKYLGFKQRLAEAEVDEDMLAKKDYDGDGKKESPADEYKGSKDKAIKKATAKKDVVDEDFAGQDDIENKGEYEQEGDMAKDQLSTIEDAAEELNSILNSDDDLPEWVQSKITKALDYVDTARDYMKSNDVSEDIYDARPDKTQLPAYLRKANAKDGEDWKLTQKDLDAHNEKNISHSKNIARRSGKAVDEDQVNEYESDDKGRYVHKGTKGYGNDLVDFDADDKDAPASKGGAPAKKRGRPAKSTGPERVTKGAWKHKDGRQINEYETDSKGRYVHKGTYGSTDSDDGNEDDYDQWGNKKAGAKKATSDAPKKRGRPAKSTGPERVTSKAWKHKDGRVKESIKLDTFVEDTLSEMDSLLVTEKAVSKAQQKFMGMVHATQKGEKAPSKEVGKVAKSMGKKDAKDFASTKHKGLPQHVKESREALVENTLQAIVRKFGKEVRDFASGGDLDDDLFTALYDHYFDDMPYGVKKARDGDPYEWITQRFDDAISQGDIEVTESNLPMETMAVAIAPDEELNELARLAGLGAPTVEASQCNHTMEGEMCPEHGLAECGSMYESKGGKPDFLDMDKDGDKEESMKQAISDKDDGEDKEDLDEAGDFIKGIKRFIKGKDNPSDVRDRHLGKMASTDDPAVKDKEGKRYDKVQGVLDKVSEDDKDLAECGMGPMGMADSQEDSGISINASFDSKTGRKTLNVTADGDSANQLAQVLKMAGLGGAQGASTTGHSHDMSSLLRQMDEPIGEIEEEFANEPNEQYADTETINDQGNDLHRRKTQYADKPKLGDNPMATEDTLALEGKLAALYNSLKVPRK